MHFQIRYPTDSQWAEIDEQQARRLLAEVYYDVDQAVADLHIGCIRRTANGAHIRIFEAARDTALPAPKPVQIEDDGELLWA